MGSGECTGVGDCKSGANPATVSPRMQTAYRVARDWKKGIFEAWKAGDTEGATNLTENFADYLRALYREATPQERKLLLKLAESFFGNPSLTTGLPNIQGVIIAESDKEFDKELIILLSYKNPPPPAPPPAPTPPPPRNSTQSNPDQEEPAYTFTPDGMKPPLGPEDIAELGGCAESGACLVVSEGDIGSFIPLGSSIGSLKGTNVTIPPEAQDASRAVGRMIQESLPPNPGSE